MRKIVFLLIIAFPLCIFAQDKDTDLEKLFIRINDAWDAPIEDGLKIWKEITAEDCFIMIIHNDQDESKTTAIDRNTFLRLFEVMQNNNPSAKHARTTKQLKIYGNIAYETAILEDIKKNGKSSKTKVLNIYRKGGFGLLCGWGAKEM